MTKQKWIEHIESVTGLTRPTKGGNVDAWWRAQDQHRRQDPNCPTCAARRRTRRASALRRASVSACLAVGLVRGTTCLGRKIWE